MGVTEIAADDGRISGRGPARTRGLITGVATLAGGLGHALPFLIHDFMVATGSALAVVCCGLTAIVAVQRCDLAMPLRTSVCQVVLGGTLVAGIGFMIGHS